MTKMPTTPAQRLQGLSLDGGWIVGQRIDLEATTGGVFSEAYSVSGPRGEKAFLKALDYSAALTAEDPAESLQKLTDTFIFERDLLQRCKDNRLDRVVTALASGLCRVDGHPVQYLVFELADSDWRQVVTRVEIELAWTIRSLHHMATGVMQLHSHDISHQDLKPSNVLVFADSVSKVADLGRAVAKSSIPPHHDLVVAGDMTYAPPELLYGSVSPEWNSRRLGCDIYLVGSMICFAFTGAGMTALLNAFLHEDHTFRRWVGTYSDVLPYVNEAFARAVGVFAEALSAAGPSVSPLELLVRQLCDPDPTRRGDPASRGFGRPQFHLGRVVTQLDLLARRAEIAAWRRT